MTNTTKSILLLTALAIPSLAQAQPADSGPTGDAAAGPVSAPAAPAPAAPAPPELADKLTGIETKLGGLEEAQAATDASVSSLKKLKLSGYIQGRYEHYQTSTDGISVSADGKKATPTNTDRFLVRRARLKAVYEGKNAEYLLQIDATGDGVTLKDAEATFVDTWTPFNLRLTLGQFKVPFGYELLQSSGEREMPERSGIVRAYFDGERDRGLRLTARYEFVRLAVALINGNGVKDTSVYDGTSSYGTQDPNKFKDFSGRLGVDFGSIVGGVSAYLGRGPMTTKVNPGTTPTDPAVPSTPATITSNYMRRTRLGVDVQGYIDVPEVGGLALKGELIWGSEAAIDWNGVASDSSKNVRKLGWIVTAVQNVGDHVGVVVRLDQSDPNTAKDDDKVTTLGGGVLLYASNNLKTTIVYQHPFEEGNAVKNDSLYAQLQAKF
jgi:hypothetical protein